MRLRLQFDKSDFPTLHNNCVMMGVEEGTRNLLVCDLRHQIQTEFNLQKLDICLEIEGYALLPKQKLNLLLRQDDIICIKRAKPFEENFKQKSESVEKIDTDHDSASLAEKKMKKKKKKKEPKEPKESKESKESKEKKKKRKRDVYNKEQQTAEEKSVTDLMGDNESKNQDMEISETNETKSNKKQKKRRQKKEETNLEKDDSLSSESPHPVPPKNDTFLNSIRQYIANTSSQSSNSSTPEQRKYNQNMKSHKEKSTTKDATKYDSVAKSTGRSEKISNVSSQNRNSTKEISTPSPSSSSSSSSYLKITNHNKSKDLTPEKRFHVAKVWKSIDWNNSSIITDTNTTSNFNNDSNQDYHSSVSDNISHMEIEQEIEEREVDDHDDDDDDSIEEEMIIDVPEKNYTADCKPLTRDPRPHDIIAFKTLQLVSRTPGVSKYKEGRVLAYDPSTKAIEIEHLFPPPEIQCKLDGQAELFNPEEPYCYELILSNIFSVLLVKEGPELSDSFEEQHQKIIEKLSQNLTFGKQKKKHPCNSEQEQKISQQNLKQSNVTEEMKATPNEQIDGEQRSRKNLFFPGMIVNISEEYSLSKKKLEGIIKSKDESSELCKVLIERSQIDDGSQFGGRFYQLKKRNRKHKGIDVDFHFLTPVSAEGKKGELVMAIRGDKSHRGIVLGGEDQSSFTCKVLFEETGEQEILPVCALFKRSNIPL